MGQRAAQAAGDERGPAVEGDHCERVTGDPETQREDLLRLLALIADPSEIEGDLRKSERQWLRVAEQRLNLSGLSLLDAETMRRAGLAYRLLVRLP